MESVFGILYCFLDMLLDKVKEIVVVFKNIMIGDIFVGVISDVIVIGLRVFWDVIICKRDDLVKVVGGILLSVD